MKRIGLLFVIGMALASCFKAHPVDGTLLCSSDPNRLCPSGYDCISGACYQHGHMPSTDMSAMSGDDLSPPPAGSDLSPGSDLLGIPPCANGVKDPGETDVDCGGSMCGPCAVNKACVTNTDCSTALCKYSFCTVTSGPPNWVTLAAAPSPRSFPALATVPDGRIVDIAGQGLPPAQVDTAEVDYYDPVANKWTPGPPNLPAAIHSAGGTVFQGIPLAVGGGMNGSGSQTIYQFYAGGPSWGAATFQIPTARSYAGPVVGPDGKLYVIGGSTPASMTYGKLVEVYDATKPAWSTAAPLAYFHTQFQSVVGVDQRIYVLGGGDGCSSLPADYEHGEVYDATKNSWSDVPTLPNPRSNHGVVAAPDGRIYLVGGFPFASNVPPLTTDLDLVDTYNPITKAWVAAPTIPTGDEGAATLGIDGRIFFLGYTGQFLSYGPQVTLSATSAAGGSTITVSGTNFGASAKVKVLFGTNPTPVATSTTSATGALPSGVTFTVPGLSPTTYPVVIVDDHAVYPITISFKITS